ncbi:MAG TPA: MarP family serine protease [Pseudonocardiaceae bacterium]|nr:MarP family serine protease [Pseudonocardiaceae bacterium]
MNWVDLLVIVLALIAAVSGARQGMVTAIASLSGVLLGAIVGVRIAPVLVERFSSATTRVVFTVAILILLVALGETIGVWAGRTVRERMHIEPIRQVDSALGTVVLALAVLVVAWLVAVPLTSASSAGLASAVKHSVILGTVDKVMPETVRQLPADLRRLLRQSGFPDVLGPFAATPQTEVEPPDPALQASPVVQQLRPSVLKVRGRAPSCGRALEGTGFVVAPERVMTNAHVVAGTEEVGVETSRGLAPGRVVLYDPETDVAVLAVPGLRAPPLPFAPNDATTGESAIVLGYPLDGPYQASGARVRERIELRGPNIYEAQTVVRDVYTVRAMVRSGNSGGPMVDPAGQVLGVVFGAAVDDDDTGFVLTADEVADEVANAPGLDARVSTGACAA